MRVALLFLFIAQSVHAGDVRHSAQAENAIQTFRSMGPKGVEAALAAGVNDAALDEVCQQHDCRTSRLFWYTDLPSAERASKAENKPILSLRLLGRLNEELSCANSRFFRTLLYSDPAIASLLREKFILHWQSERPAPRITIDFGDGRKMVQTITGNSIHYFLDSDGQVLDALPGLYSPAGFRRALVEMTAFWQKWGTLDAGQRPVVLADYHEVAERRLTESWHGNTPLMPVASYTRSTGRVPARDAVIMAATKAVVEIRPVQQVQPESTDESAQLKNLKDFMDTERWSPLAKVLPRLSQESEALVRTKLVYDPSTGLTRTPLEIQKTLESLEHVIAIDELRNDYVYRRALHEWLADPKADRRLETLNRRVYESLFLTPGNDPWLGLKPDGVYTGIKGDGISVAGP